MNYYKHYMGDYQRDTGHLSLAQDGAYRRMMDHYYSTEQALPADAVSLYRICGAMDKKEREAVMVVAEMFFAPGVDGRLHHARIDEEIAIAQEKITKLKANAASGGKKSGETRRSKSEANASTKSEANASEDEEANGSSNAQADANNTNNQYPVNTNTPIPPEGGVLQEVPKRARRKREGELLQDYLDRCKTEGVKPIPADDPIFDYVRDVGLTDDMLVLAWFVFKTKYLKPGKTQKDWLAHYRNAVKGNWCGLWYFGNDGSAGLTTAGIQAQREMDAKNRRAA